MPYLHKCMSRVSSLSLMYITFFSSLFSSHHATCRLLNERTLLVLNDSFSPGKLMPCTSAFRISRDTSCELASVSYKRPKLPSLPLLFSAISGSLRILLRTMVLFELKLHCLEGPLNAGVMQCPDGSGTCRAMLGRCSSYPSSLWFVLTLCWVVWEKEKKKKLFCFNVVVLFFCCFGLAFFFFFNVYILWGQRKFLQLFSLFIAGI